jgi:hypothetical protein
MENTQPIIKSHEDIQNDLVKDLIKKGKRFIQCPNCKTVYPGATSIVKCGYCGNTDKHYSNNKGTIKMDTFDNGDRNRKCYCGSGLKYKFCHYLIEKGEKPRSKK